MKRFKLLSKKNTIGFIATSFGLFDSDHITRYNNAKRFFINEGYNIVESNSLFNENFLGVSNGYIRAKEFMDMFLDDSVSLMMSVAGGETLLEALEYIDFEKLKKAKGKYFIGYSDNTCLTFLLTTICDFESIYSIHATSYNDIFLNHVKDNYKLLTSNKLEFDSYDLYENEIGEFVNEIKYDGTCDTSGILIGGCLEVLNYLCGTKYDNMSNFNKKYSDIIFYIEPYELKPLQVRFALWQLRNAGWFNNVKAFVFGRTQNNYDYLSYKDAIYRALGDLNIPIIVNFDVGHIQPTIPMINGRCARLIVKDGKGKLIYDEWYYKR